MEQCDNSNITLYLYVDVVCFKMYIKTKPCYNIRLALII